MSLALALSKIRPHTASSLPHQKAPANLLVAIETTLVEQGSERTPTAYFAALLTALDTSKSNPTFGEGDVLPAILYLLALVVPFVPVPVIRSNLSVLLSSLSPIFPPLLAHAPPLRSQLTIFCAVIKALDPSFLDKPELLQVFNLILELTVDPRPKVRKRAAEVVRDVLSNVSPPLLVHPYAGRVGEWIVSTLTIVNSGAGSFGKSTKTTETMTGPEAGIHIVAMVKPIVSHLPRSALPSIVNALLSLPRLGNPYLSQSSYSLLTAIVSDDSTSSDITPLVHTLLSSSPLKTDATQTPAWLELHQAAFSTGSVSLDDKGADTVFKSIFNYLQASDTNIRKAAAETLSSFLSKVITKDMIAAAVREKDNEKKVSSVSKITAHLRASLNGLQYVQAIPQILTVLAALLKTLSFRPSNKSIHPPPTAAEILVLDLVQHTGDLRVKEGFEHKEATDQVLRTAMGVLGPEVLLKILPLRLLPEERSSGKDAHAYLLSLLPVPHPCPLSHFVNYFVPLSEKMFNLQQSATEAGRNSEAKMWEVLIGQIWNGLVGYCHAPRDLPETFDTRFAQLLSQILYNQPSLRPAILKALKVIVVSNYETESDVLTAEDKQRNLEHLKKQAENWFAVFFNVFGSIGQESRGMVGDVISAWVKIAGDESIVKMYRKVVTLFQQELNKPSKNQPPKGSDAPNVLLMFQDLLILVLPQLPQPECKELWDLCSSGAVMGHPESGVQKRGYRILMKLIESGPLSGVLNVEDVITNLTSSSDVVSAPAKRDRVSLIALLLPSVPPTSLHLIPVLIPEAVLATKEPAERTRSAAFDLVVAMGHKMKEGGVVKRNRLNEMQDEDAHEVKATVEEYITMMAAGLVGGTPHMISATITAISRLVFEFKDDISTTMLDEMLSTMLVFVTSANREIVKSALGFIKLSVHTLPVELVTNHLQQLVPALLNWSGDHKNHFKVKVRHIFERMIRRFGWDAVYSCVGDNPEKGKVLQNIKKRKDRAKRKKAKAEAEGEDEEEEEAPTKKTGDAFEDVLYGSESEIEDSDDDDGPARQSNKTKGREKGARIRLDDDKPMDLLQSAADRVIVGKGKDRRRKPGQEAPHFRQDEETGRMIIEDEDDDAGNGEDENEHEEDVAGGAYRESLTSADGFTRGPGGRIKFNKDTKKRRANNADEDGDIDMDDANVPKQSNKKMKREIKLGREFKAKRAGGDVKKGDVDPYAYLPLSQAAKKKGGKQQRINLVGRR